MSRQTLVEITKLGKKILPKNAHLWLYGSHARGDFHDGSDWDLLVLLDKESQQWHDFDLYANPFIERGWELGEDIRPQIYTKAEWEQQWFTPFYHNVERDKVKLL